MWELVEHLDEPAMNLCLYGFFASLESNICFGNFKIILKHSLKGYWLVMCYGRFHLYRFSRAVMKTKQVKHNLKNKFIVGLERNPFRLEVLHTTNYTSRNLIVYVLKWMLCLRPMLVYRYNLSILVKVLYFNYLVSVMAGWPKVFDGTCSQVLYRLRFIRNLWENQNVQL